MKAKKTVAPSPKKQKEISKTNTPASEDAYDRIGYLAEAYLKIHHGTDADCHYNAIWHLNDRATALCHILREVACSESPNEFPKDALDGVMIYLEQDLKVAQRLTRALYSKCNGALAL